MTKLNEFMKKELFRVFIDSEYECDSGGDYTDLLNKYFETSNVSKYLYSMGMTIFCRFLIAINSPSLHDSIHKIVLVVVPDREGLVIEQVNYQAIDEEDCWLSDEWRSNEFNSLRGKT